jgi:hypothetical protein
MISTSMLSVIIIGCGNNAYQLAPANGRVTCDGKPATGGTVIFMPIDAPEKTGRPKGQPGIRSTGMVRDDGTFALVRDAVAAEGEAPGAIIGPHEVFFVLPRTEPYQVHPEDKRNLPPGDLKKLEAELAQKPIFAPLDCGDVISPKTVEVGPDGNEFTFTLAPLGSSPRRRTLPSAAARGPQ